MVKLVAGATDSGGGGGGGGGDTDVVVASLARAITAYILS